MKTNPMGKGLIGHSTKIKLHENFAVYGIIIIYHQVTQSPSWASVFRTVAQLGSLRSMPRA